MPKLTLALPKYRKHRASGQAIVTLNGHDHYLGPHGTAASRHEYDRLIAEYLARGRRWAPEQEADQVSVNEVLVAFLGHAKVWYVKNGQQTNEYDAYRVLMRDIKRLYGQSPAVEFGPLAFFKSARTDPATLSGKCLKELSRSAASNETIESLQRQIESFKSMLDPEHLRETVIEELTNEAFAAPDAYGYEADIERMSGLNWCMEGCPIYTCGNG